MKSINITIEDLFEYLEINNKKYDEFQTVDKQLYVKSDLNEIIPIRGYVKKQDKQIVRCHFDDEYIDVADTHSFRKNNDEIFAKDCEGSFIDTLKDSALVTKVEYLDKQDVYDVGVDDPHWYCHNDTFVDGIISHNTTHLASHLVNVALSGKNVAYFTFEDGEEGIGSRIDENLMSKTLDELKEENVTLSTTFDSIIKPSMGKIKIKEFPTGSANVNHIRQVLQDWRLKDGFVPEAIYVDYVGIMASIKSSSNGYEKGKNVAEELRSLAVELDMAVISAVQARRDVFNADKLSMADVQDSIAISQTADVMIGILEDETHPDRHVVSVLKSRELNKAKLAPTFVNVSTEFQRVWAVEGNEAYTINKSDKGVLDNMEKMVEASSKVTAEVFEENSTIDDILKGNF